MIIPLIPRLELNKENISNTAVWSCFFYIDRKRLIGFGNTVFWVITRLKFMSILFKEVSQI